MFYFQIHCKPQKDNVYYSDVEGAYVTVLIDFKDEDGANQLATYYVSKENWEIIAITDSFEVEENALNASKEHKEVYEHMKLNGMGLKYHLYYADEP